MTEPTQTAEPRQASPTAAQKRAAVGTHQWKDAPTDADPGYRYCTRCLGAAGMVERSATACPRTGA